MKFKIISSIFIAFLLTACNDLGKQLEVKKIEESNWLSGEANEGISIQNKGNDPIIKKVIFNKGKCEIPFYLNPQRILYKDTEVRMVPGYTQKACERIKQVEIITAKGSVYYRW